MYESVSVLSMGGLYEYTKWKKTFLKKHSVLSKNKTDLTPTVSVSATKHVNVTSTVHKSYIVQSRSH